MGAMKSGRHGLTSASDAVRRSLARFEAEPGKASPRIRKQLERLSRELTRLEELTPGLSDGSVKAGTSKRLAVAGVVLLAAGLLAAILVRVFIHRFPEPRAAKEFAPPNMADPL